MVENNFEWLMRWYLRECDDDWEHSYGVKIDTLDNPGWTLQIDLRGTAMEGRSLKSTHGEPATNLNEWHELGSWWVANANGERFDAACGPLDLLTVIGVFRMWVEAEDR